MTAIGRIIIRLYTNPFEDDRAGLAGMEKSEWRGRYRYLMVPGKGG